MPADDLPKCRSAVAAIRMTLTAATYVPSWHLSCLCLNVTSTTVQAPSRHASEFYKRVIHVFQEKDIDFLVGGAFAFVRYTGIGRDTKDLDLFIRRADWDAVTVAARGGRHHHRAHVSALARQGVRRPPARVLRRPDLLGRQRRRRSGRRVVCPCRAGRVARLSGAADAGGRDDLVEGIPDGARALRRRGRAAPDARAPAATSTGRRLLSRFGEHWRVLLSHLVLFPYVYPNEPAPQQVIDELLDRARSEPKAGRRHPACAGGRCFRARNIWSTSSAGITSMRAQVPLGTMTPEEIDIWTKAIETRTNKT